MATSSEPLGATLMRSAIRIVLDELRAHPSGIRNVDIANATGLYLPVKSHPGYISYTILMYLVEQGSVEKRGQLYRLRS